MILWSYDDSPFGIGKAEKLDWIGKRLGTLNSSVRKNLPPGLGCLHLLADLERDILLKLIHEKLITRKTKIRDAEALLEKYNGQSKRRTSAFNMKRWRARLQTLKEKLETEGSPQDWPLGIAAFEEALHDFRAILAARPLHSDRDGPALRVESADSSDQKNFSAHPSTRPPTHYETALKQ